MVKCRIWLPAAKCIECINYKVICKLTVEVLALIPLSDLLELKSHSVAFLAFNSLFSFQNIDLTKTSCRLHSVLYDPW